MHLGVLSAGIEDGGHSRSFDHFDSEFQETAFNIILVYWIWPAEGCYTSQMCEFSYLYILLNLTIDGKNHAGTQ